MKNLKVREYDGPNETPAIPTMAHAWAEMLEAGTAPNVLLYSWDEQLLIATIGDTVVGFMTYVHQKHTKTIWLHVGYVIPKFRKCGIYKALWAHMGTVARKLNAVAIEGETSVTNIKMRKVAARLDRREIGVTTRFDVLKSGKRT